MSEEKKFPFKLTIIISVIIIGITSGTLGIMYNDDVFGGTSYDNNCRVHITTTNDLTLNTKLTDVTKHFKELSPNVPASEDDEYYGEIKYGWNGSKNPSFNVYYNVDATNAILKIHAHCYTPFLAYSEVHSMSVEMVGGSQDILFSASKKIKDVNGGPDMGYVKLYPSDKTGFWFEVTGTSEQVFYSIGDNLSGKIYGNGDPLVVTHVSDKTYEIKICETNLNKCATDEIYIATDSAPLISCEYKKNTPSLSCEASW